MNRDAFPSDLRDAQLALLTPLILPARLGGRRTVDIREIVKRSDDRKYFVVLPKRWIVERPFAWFGRYRRLSKDYEQQPATSEALIRIVMIQLMLKRLEVSV